MPRVSREEFKALVAKAKTKKAKRKVKAKKLGHKIEDRGKIKTQICRLLGMIDAFMNGKECRIHGSHSGEVAYHLCPQSRGDAARFLPENVIWACKAANYGEFRNRSLYRDKHIAIFGQERIEAIEEIAGNVRQFSYKELVELRDEARAIIEALLTADRDWTLKAIAAFRRQVLGPDVWGQGQ